AALAIYPQIGDRLGEANVQKALGDLALREDDLGEARRCYEAALAIYPQIGDRLGEANVQKALGDLALREDDLGEARRCYEAALAIYPQIGDRLGEANVLAALARVELLEGQAERAMILLTRALNFYQSINDRYSIAVALYYFGFDLLRLDRRDDAAPLLLQAAGLFEEIGLPQYAVQLRQMAGDAPTPEQQAARLKAAVAELRQRGDASLLLQALAALLALHMEMENWPGAVDTAQELLTIDAANAKAWAMLADAYARLDNEEAAANAYAHAVAGDDANAMLRRNYANTLIPLGRLDEAAAQLAAG
ncbi:MAG: tetratricopeptide repeat protein, partial [Caldilinea sp.]|nr:tetratricopeptide repeat protein [Caldilinea sp.]